MAPYHHFSSATVNDITRERYGTDVPHLAREIHYLKNELRRTRQENNELQRRYRNLHSDCTFLSQQLDRYKAKLREAKAMLHWRL